MSTLASSKLTSSRLQAFNTRNVFAHTKSTLTFPLAQVIASISTLGCARAIMIACESSMPVSTSRITLSCNIQSTAFSYCTCLYVHRLDQIKKIHQDRLDRSHRYDEISVQKRRGYNVDLHTCFIYYSKIFNCFKHQILCNIMREIGCPSHLKHITNNKHLSEQLVKHQAGSGCKGK